MHSNCTTSQLLRSMLEFKVKIQSELKLSPTVTLQSPPQSITLQEFPPIMTQPTCPLQNTLPPTSQLKFRTVLLQSTTTPNSLQSPPTSTSDPLRSITTPNPLQSSSTLTVVELYSHIEVASRSAHFFCGYQYW